MSIRLKELIKQVREAKTREDERKIIADESAAIRDSLKSKKEYRARNIAKLLYIQMLGYPTQFGQMECLNLIVSSTDYTHKRIGYLGLTLLLDENQEVLMLATNSLKDDMDNENPFVTGLALCALGNICSNTMAQDLSPEVDRLLASSNPYLRKKAALCATRMVRKVPELADLFQSKIKNLLRQKDHSVLVTSISLMIQICEADPTACTAFAEHVDLLVRILKALQSTYAPEYDVGGINDPYLQVNILKLLGVLGKDNAETSEQMTGILAYVANNTDNGRNVGHAILYECVRTIMTIECDEDLRAIGIKILGKFLSNTDNNIRYVALNTLCSSKNVDKKSIQRYHNTVIDCLKDHDVSIRKRALDLIYTLMDQKNVNILVRELLNFLTVGDSSFKSDLVAKLSYAAEKYAPSKKWYIDTILRIISLYEKDLPEEVLTTLVGIISFNEDLHSYAVQKMLLALMKDFTHQSLVRVGVWCIGEYGDLLSEDGSIEVSELEIITLLQNILSSVTTSSICKQIILTALGKLAARLSYQVTPLISDILTQYSSSMNLEIQQRACEYLEVLEWDEDQRKHIFDRIPSLDPNFVVEDHQVDESDSDDSDSVENTGLPSIINLGGGSTIEQKPSLFIGINPISETPKPVDNGFLGGLDFSRPVITNPNPTPSPITSQPQQASLYPIITAYENRAVRIRFAFSKTNPNNPGITVIKANVENLTNVQFNNFVFQAAPPGSHIKYTVGNYNNSVPARGATVVSVGAINYQQGQQPLVMAIRITFSANGSQQEIQQVVNNIPTNI